MCGERIDEIYYVLYELCFEMYLEKVVVVAPFFYFFIVKWF